MTRHPQTLVARAEALPDAETLRRRAIRRWLYVGDDALWRRDALAGSLRELDELDTGEAREAHVQRLRTPFLTWIGQLGRDQEQPAWWATSLAAKSPYATVLLRRIVALSVGLDILAEHSDEPLLVVCSTPALAAAMGGGPAAARRRPDARRALRFATAAALAVLPLGLLRALARRPGLQLALAGQPAYRRRVAVRDGPHAAATDGERVTLVPTWVDGRSFDAGGTYRDPTLGPLVDALAGQGRRVLLLPRVLPSLPYAEALARLRASGRAFAAPDALLTAADWRWATRVAQDFDLALRPGTEVLEGLAVGDLAREHVDEHRHAMVDALAYDRLVRRLDDAGVRPERIVLPYEGHAWEQVLTSAARECWPAVRVIGWENLNVSSLALSMYPAPEEHHLRPLPDIVVTNGPTFADRLRREGYPPAMVREGGALRHVGLAVHPARRPAQPVRVVVATTIDAGESLELIDTARAALGDRADIDLVVRAHPALDRRALDGLGLPLAEGPIDAVLRAADVLLYAYSAVALDALAAGVPPVHVASRTLLDLDQLEPFPQLRARVRSAAELLRAVEAIAAWDDATRAAWSRDAERAVRQTLAPLREGWVSDFLG